MNTRKVFTLILTAICSCQTLMAQMPTPGQSVSVSASASVAPSSNYKLKDADGIVLGESSVTDDMRAVVSANIPLYRKGRELSLGIMPYYHFSGMRLKEDFGLNFGSDHHRYGAIVMGTASTRLFGRPFSVMGMINADGWEQGYGQTQFICAGVWALIRNERTYLGLGPVVLLGTSSTPNGRSTSLWHKTTSPISPPRPQSCLEAWRLTANASISIPHVPNFHIALCCHIAHGRAAFSLTISCTDKSV